MKFSFANAHLRRTAKLLFITAILYVMACLTLVINERSFVYIPFPGPTDPKRAGLSDYTQQFFTTADKLQMPYWEHVEPDAPILIYFHGNGGGLHAFVEPLHYLATQKLHVMAMEYRGYPGAPGRPNERAIVRDATNFVDHVKLTYPNRPIVIWGYSLGSGVAVQAAAIHPPNALILEAPFSATVDRASELYPWMPVRHLMRDQFLSREIIGSINTPLFIMHGEDDLIVPIHLGEALFDRANEPKIFKRYPKMGHLDLMQSSAYDDAIAFIREKVQQ